MLPSQKKKRDYSVLESDPEASRLLDQSVRRFVLAVLVSAAFAVLIYPHALTAFDTAESRSGLLKAVLVVLIIALTVFALLKIRLKVPLLLKYWFIWAVVFLAGWFTRGLYETAVSTDVSRAGFYAGLWMMPLIAGLVVSIWLIYNLARMLNGRQAEDGA